MSNKKENLLSLQREWYQRLADAGFQDIERLRGETLVLIKIEQGWNSKCCWDHTTPHWEANEEYYVLINQRVKDSKTFFRNDIDRHILNRYAEGAKIKTIVEELIVKGTPRDRKSVRIIIRRYEMAWHIRFYTRAQLNMKQHG